MKHAGERVFAALLVLAMVLALVPAGLAAVRTDPENGGKTENGLNETADGTASQNAGSSVDRKRIVVKTFGETPDADCAGVEMLGNYAVLDFENEESAAAAFAELKKEYDEVSYSVKAFCCDTGAKDYKYKYDENRGFLEETGLAETRAALLKKYGSADKMPKIVVGVIDSGIDREHEIFAGRINSAKYDFVDEDDDASDQYGHGTKVAGVIADLTLPNVKINAYRAGDGELNEIAIVKAIRQAIEDKVDILNMSFGSNMISAIKKEAIDEALAAGIVVIVAAGNDSTDAVTHFPASYAPVITVGAVEAYRCDYDEYGKMIYYWEKAEYSNDGVCLDIAAPGKVNMPQLDGGYSFDYGTSFAAPAVSAAAAMYLTYYPDADRFAVEQWLVTNAFDFGNDGFDTDTGHGILRFGGLTSKTLAPAPTFSEYGGNKDKGFKLTLKVPDGYKLYYTTDGALPVKNGKPSGKQYTGAIEIKESTDLTVAVVGKNAEPCIVRERYYIGGKSLFSDFTYRNGFAYQYCGFSPYVTIPKKLYGKTVYGFDDTFHWNAYVEEVTVPDGISLIGDCAFHSANVKKVTIGKDVCKIGHQAFKKCHADIVLSPENPYLVYDGKGLYSKDGVFYYYNDSEPNEEYVLPECIDRLMLEDFAECSNLEKLVFGKNVREIEFCYHIISFTKGSIQYQTSLSRHCTVEVDPGNPYYSSDKAGSLYSKDGSILYTAAGIWNEEVPKLVIPGTVRSVIDRYALLLQASELRFEEGVEEICCELADAIASGANVYFPSSLGYVLWLEKRGMETVHFWFAGDAPSTLEVENDPGIVLHYYKEAKGFDAWKKKYPDATYVERTDGKYHSDNIEYPIAGGKLLFNTKTGSIIRAEGVKGDLTIPEKINGVTVKKICGNAFQEANIGKLVIPKTVTKIGSWAFRQSTVKSVKILGDVKEIEEFAFGDCEELTNIEILGKTEIIGMQAFFSLNRLARTVKFPDSLRIIGAQAFNGTEFLNFKKFPDSLEKIEEMGMSRAFCGDTDKSKLELTLPDGLTLEWGAIGVIGRPAVIRIGSLASIEPLAMECGNDLTIRLSEKLPAGTYMPFPASKGYFETKVICEKGVEIEDMAAIGTKVQYAGDDSDDIKGDINGDGKVNAQDCLLMRGYILKTFKNATAEQIERMNLNGDKSVNAMDYALLRAIVLGKYQPA